jgi:hypothetical protein
VLPELFLATEKVPPAASEKHASVFSEEQWLAPTATPGCVAPHVRRSEVIE